MKKVAVFGLVFALFLLPVFMPLVKAENTVHNAKTLHHEHKHKQRVRVRKIRQRPKTGNKGILKGLTAEERQAAKEQGQERREEARLLLQKQRAENLKEQKEKHMQEPKGKLRERHKPQRRNTVKKAGQELQPELKEESAQQGQETMHQGTRGGQHH